MIMNTTSKENDSHNEAMNLAATNPENRDEQLDLQNERCFENLFPNDHDDDLEELSKMDIEKVKNELKNCGHDVNAFIRQVNFHYKQNAIKIPKVDKASSLKTDLAKAFAILQEAVSRSMTKPQNILPAHYRSKGFFKLPTLLVSTGILKTPTTSSDLWSYRVLIAGLLAAVLVLTIMQSRQLDKESSSNGGSVQTVSTDKPEGAEPPLQIADESKVHVYAPAISEKNPHEGIEKDLAKLFSTLSHKQKDEILNAISLSSLDLDQKTTFLKSLNLATPDKETRFHKAAHIEAANNPVNICSDRPFYTHEVQEGDSLSSVISKCQYTADFSSFSILPSLNTGDIIQLNINDDMRHVDTLTLYKDTETHILNFTDASHIKRDSINNKEFIIAEGIISESLHKDILNNHAFSGKWKLANQVADAIKIKYKGKIDFQNLKPGLPYLIEAEYQHNSPTDYYKLGDVALSILPNQ